MYSIGFEIDRVNDVLSRLSWYKERGYVVSLPKGIVGLDLPTPEETIDSIT